ncbi:hypothetical protein QP164_02595 [Sphingomonas sp. LR59]|uniref:hypothetical protein n=1 Tax=Sphingomonas sp. LR59 TaxID=3050232 RepID=UPI002FE2A66C
MRFEDMPMAAARENDSPSMIRAIERLLMAGAEARRPIGNPHQIKVTPDLSFYPTTGRMLFDGGPAQPERGVDALIELLARQRE